MDRRLPRRVHQGAAGGLGRHLQVVPLPLDHELLKDVPQAPQPRWRYCQAQESHRDDVALNQSILKLHFPPPFFSLFCHIYHYLLVLILTTKSPPFPPSVWDCTQPPIFTLLARIRSTGWVSLDPVALWCPLLQFAARISVFPSSLHPQTSQQQEQGENQKTHFPTIMCRRVHLHLHATLITH